jgi:hypothetical protein
LTIPEKGGHLNRRRHEPTEFDQARDELFSHIHRCAVLQAEAEQQIEWLDDTLQFMAERYPGLGRNELTQLRDLGLRFCQPVIPHGATTAVAAHPDASAA